MLLRRLTPHPAAPCLYSSKDGDNTSTSLSNTPHSGMQSLAVVYKALILFLVSSYTTLLHYLATPHPESMVCRDLLPRSSYSSFQITPQQSFLSKMTKLNFFRCTLHNCNVTSICALGLTTVSTLKLEAPWRLDPGCLCPPIYSQLLPHHLAWKGE